MTTAPTSTSPIAAAGFTSLDWLALALYGLVILVSGILLSRRKQKDTGDYFLAGRSIPAWAAAISLLATSLSAVTFIGGPEIAFKGNLTYLSATIGSVIGILIVAFVFVPRYYRQNVTTVYELLQTRFGAKGRTGASLTFMVGRIFASGARVYVGALPAALIVFGDTTAPHMLMAIGAIVVVGIGYTFIGGIRSVIWTDVIQLVILVGAALVSLIVLYGRLDADLGRIIETLAHSGPGGESKLRVIELGLDSSEPMLGFDPSQYYTLLTAMTGLVLFNVAAFGTDHDLAQRILTCRSAKHGALAAIGGVVVGIPVTALFMLVGLLLFIFYQHPELVASGAGPTVPADSAQKVFLTFILHEIPPGVTGLMMAGLFAAGLSSFNSALNALSSTFVNDCYRRFRPGLDERSYLRAGRAAIVGWGLVLGGFAAFCIVWQQASQQTLIDFALSVMIFAYSGLLAVFAAAIFTRRGNGVSVICALLAGFAVTVTMQPMIWPHLAPWIPWIGSRIAGVSLAFPWQMLIASTIAFGVCCAGRSPDVRSVAD